MHNKAQPKRRPWLHAKLRAKILLMLLGLSLGPLLVGGISNVFRAIGHNKASERARYNLAARFTADAFSELLARVISDTRLLAQRFPAEAVDFDHLKADLDAGHPPTSTMPGWRDLSVFDGLHPEYASVFLALPDGRLIFTHPYRHLSSPPNLSEAEWWPQIVRAQHSGGRIIVGRLRALAPQRTMIAVVPLLSETSDALLAYIGLVVDPFQLQEVVERAVTAHGGKHHDFRAVALVDTRHFFVAHSKPGFTHRAVPSHLRALRGVGTFEVPRPNGDLLVARARVDRTGWSVLVVVPLEHAYRHVYVLIWSMTIIVVLTLFFVLFFADYITGLLLRPLRELEQGAKMIGAGALDYRIDLEGHRDDELGHLAATFNQAASNLQASHREAAAYGRHLEVANQELDAMVFAISHDLRKPLRGIEAFATFLEEDYTEVLDEDGIELLHAISGNVDRISALADDLIGLVDSERERSDARRFHSGALLDEVRARVLNRYTGKIEIAGEMPELFADRARVALVFDNLIDNGLKFNRSAAPRVIVRCVDLGLVWRFEIKDNGIGIDPKYHARIFELFRRLNHKDEFPGSGAGLNLTSRIVEEHRGTLSIESAKGAGALFILTLPKDPTLPTG